MRKHLCYSIGPVIADILYRAGVRSFVCSPGSRNAPLLEAFYSLGHTYKNVRLLHIVDERSAGFVAMGIAAQSNVPVALCCTSGSAPLGYLPALAEASHRNLPVIVISADREARWIDRHDSQTIRQTQALDPLVKLSVDVPVIKCDDDALHAVNLINHVILTALRPPCGPVQINVQVSNAELVQQSAPVAVSLPVITDILPDCVPHVKAMRLLAHKIMHTNRVMILCGNMPPEAKLHRALVKLSAAPNVTILSERIANLNSPDFITAYDKILADCNDKTELQPDLLISIGGAIVSSRLKAFLRNAGISEHWHIGQTEMLLNTFDAMTQRIVSNPSRFFEKVVKYIRPLKLDVNYRDIWLAKQNHAIDAIKHQLPHMPWSDFKAISIIGQSLPRSCNVHLSNGTVVRYAQQVPDFTFHRIECNRGVSGIEGSTSTALGASTVTDIETVLITGDMSAQYDVAALSFNTLPANLKIVVMCNGAGGIFQIIRPTRYLEVADEAYRRNVNFPARELAAAYGIKYFEAHNENELRHSIDIFIKHKGASMLAVYTDAGQSAQTINQLMNQ